MDPWERVVYTIKCDLDTALIDGKRQRVAGRVVLVRFDGFTYEYRKVLDTYVKYPPRTVVDFHERYSRLTPALLSSGIDRESVVDVVLKLVSGQMLVTFAGRTVFAALGINDYVIDRYVYKHIELQDHFKRQDGQPYALGPLIVYFGYRVHGRQVVLNRDLVQDAYFQLRLYNDHYSANDLSIRCTRS